VTGVVPEGVDGAMALLGDMPLAGNQLAAPDRGRFEAKPGGLVAAVYDGEWQSETSSAAALFPDVATLTGDAGARRLLQARRDMVIEVPAPQRGGVPSVQTKPNSPKPAPRPPSRPKIGDAFHSRSHRLPHLGCGPAQARPSSGRLNPCP